VTIASATGSTRRRHSLPRVGYSEAQRRQVAQNRMRADIGKATDAARQLVTAWTQACERFPSSLAASGHRPATAELEAEVLLDLVEQHTRGFREEDRAGLKTVVADTEQLKTIPFLSAAHVAGAWAVWAKRLKTLEARLRCQLEAGRWIQEVTFR